MCTSQVLFLKCSKILSPSLQHLLLLRSTWQKCPCPLFEKVFTLALMFSWAKRIPHFQCTKGCISMHSNCTSMHLKRSSTMIESMVRKQVGSMWRIEPMNDLARDGRISHLQQWSRKASLFPQTSSFACMSRFLADRDLSLVLRILWCAPQSRIYFQPLCATMG